MAERMTREAEVLSTRLQKAQQDNENQVITLEKLVHENGKKTSELKVKFSDLNNFFFNFKFTGGGDFIKMNKIKEKYLKLFICSY